MCRLDTIYVMFPIVKILFLWIIGILILPFIQFSLGELLIFFAIFSCLFVALHFRRGHSFKFLENVLLVLILLTVVQLLNYHSSQEKYFNAYQNKEHKVLLKIKERYKQTDYQFKYIVDLQAVFRDSVVVINTDCLLLQKKDTLSSHFYPGDRFYASIYWKQIAKAKHSALFDSFEYWRLKGITGSLWLQEGTVEMQEKSNDWFYQIRRKQAEWLELIQRQNLSESTRQIISALVLGDKRSVDKEIKYQFSNLGLAHALALSGLHISLIYGICAFILGLVFKYRPALQSLSLVLIIVTYAILTGLSPSVMRASLMFLLYAFSLSINRRTTPLNIVFISALILLIYDSNLLYDIGFQLSYLAVLGILYFYRFFKKYFEHKSIPVKFILGMALVSVSAQLSTGILSVYYFHSFPLSFLWANLLILPMITFLLYLSVFYLFFLVVGIRIPLIDSFLDRFVDLLLNLLSIIEAYSFSPLEFYITRNELFYYYGLLLFICLVFFEKKFKFLHFFYLYLLVGVVVYDLKQGKPKELFINASKQALVISIVANDEQAVMSDNLESTSYLLGDYSLINSIVCVDSLSMESSYQNEFCRIRSGLVELFDEKLLIIENQKLNSENAMHVDVLIQRIYRWDVKDLCAFFSPSVVILDAKMYKKSREILKRQWLDLNVEVVDLSEEVYTRLY